jgi:tellurite methyltransferase
MSESRLRDPPSFFVAHWISLLAARGESLASNRPTVDPPRRALDVAMGRGRHAVALADAGFQVFGVDIKYEAVRAAATLVRERGGRLHGWCADLTVFPLPRGRFELIVVARYLQRDLFPALRKALSPGGVLVYETFTDRTSPDHLLKPGELRQRADDLDVLFYEEVTEPEAVARLVARKTVNHEVTKFTK